MSDLKQSSVALLEDAIDRKIRNAQKGRDTTLATVTRVDSDGTTWVRVYGGSDETPVRRMTSSAQVGDVINVVFTGLSCIGTGNITQPAATVVQVKEVEVAANGAAKAALTAWEHADDAAQAASTAWNHADEALDAATAAQGAAEAAQSSADAAQGAAEAAQGLADAAAGAASNAQNSADAAARAAATADDKAEQAGRAASSAQDSADIANRAANSALIELSIVEDVAGTLDWISEHGTYTATTDTSVVEGKVYFSYDSTTHDYTPVVEPTGNPQSQGWYVLDVTDSQTDFIMAHLAVTTRGLWVLPSGIASTDQTVDNNVDKASSSDTAAQKQANANARKGPNYKVLLSNDGMYVYDGSGALVTEYGESITFSSDRAQYIGNEDAYIVFTPASDSTPASITIGGSNIHLGDSRTLSELLSEVDTPTFHITEQYSQDGTSVTVTAHVMVGGTDVTSSYPGSCFAWYTKSETGNSPLVPIQSQTGYSVTLQRSAVGFGCAVVCHFTEPNDSVLLDSDDDTLTDSDDTPLAGRTPSGDYVRVADLTATTTIFDTDKLMLVGSESENLVTIATLRDYLALTTASQVEFGTTAQWNARPTLVGQAHTLYVYTDHSVDSHGNNVAGIKAGDGSAYLIDLPFTDAVTTEHMADTDIHITASERTFWNNKVRAYYAASEQLVLTTA